MKIKLLAVLIISGGLLIGNLSNAFALEGGDWMVRFGATMIDPNSGSDNAFLGATRLAGTDAEVDSDTQLGITIEYMLTSNWGIELLLATPFEHDIEPNAALAAVTGNSKAIGETDQLPPTLSLNYHFQPTAGWRPYVGVGINYTVFFNEDTSGGLKTNLGYTSLDLDDSWGLALQAGVDIDLSANWFGNLNVRYIDIDTDATAKRAGAANLTIDNVEIDPWIYSIGIGTTF
ncbi:MAG: outer membrane beta-barrel protein [Gammaproteobacteria bacterium]|nr:MAG: outer membrane beta-barrel protein [Gammaproteobacteria bacterium]